MWIPQALGGSELAPAASLEVIEALAKIDAATGWVVSNCSFISMVPQFLPDPVVEKVLGDPGAVICGSFVPPGTAELREDGYRVTGNWTFGSASHDATSPATLAVVTDGGEPVIGNDGVEAEEARRLGLQPAVDPARDEPVVVVAGRRSAARRPARARARRRRKPARRSRRRRAAAPRAARARRRGSRAGRRRATASSSGARRSARRSRSAPLAAPRWRSETTSVRIGSS